MQLLRYLSSFLTIFLVNICESAKPSVIIVGAGTAGVSAATRLLQHDFTDIVILEAQNRIGGRMHSVKFGEAYVDLGPRHCMGTRGNIVYETVKDLGILDYFPLASDMYYSKNEKIEGELKNEILSLLDQRTVPSSQRTQYYNVSTGEYILNRFYKTKLSTFKDREDLIKPTLRFAEQEFLRDTGPQSWFVRPIVNDYIEIPGGNYVWSGHGYITYLKTLIHNLPLNKQKVFNESLLFKKFVNRVYWQGAKKIIVTCLDGSVYSADYVIFTPSLGILKHLNKIIFVPNLPSKKRYAIETLLYGGEYKAAFRFEKRWWPNNYDFYGFYLLWAEEDIKKVPLEFPQGVLKNGDVWVKDIFVLTAERNNSNVLICWIASRNVIEIELLHDDVIFEGCTYAMFKFFKYKFDVTRPNGMISEKQWLSPFYLGPYSFQTLNSPRGKRSANVEIEKPLRNGKNSYLLFAGETVHPIYFQTVHGATESGYKQADRIINNNIT